MDQGQQSFSFEKKPPQQSKALSVSDLNQAIKSNIENEFQTLWLKGEISNFKAHSSGHYYFSLKDSNSQISAVMFKGSNSRLNFRPKDGMEVIVRGKVTVYAPRGNYQILCEKMDPVGQGGLKEEFEKLKLKLKAEGLFEIASKKPLPYLPFHIALVTSPTGAAVRDMINVLQRRHPAAQVTVVPSLTQGERASADLIRAIGDAEKIPGVEVIILSRGGGSLEDMWCFNDEALARRIHSMKIPVVSGVGHEIDFTISDFVSDLRAPTPSAAAEIVCKNVDEIKEKILQVESRLKHKVWNLIQNKKALVGHIGKRLVDPRRKLLDLRLKVDELVVRSQKSIESKLSLQSANLKSYSKRLGSIRNVISPRLQKLGFLNQKIMNAEVSKLSGLKNKVDRIDGVLHALSPYGVLDRGYSIVRNLKTGKIIKTNEKVKLKDQISIQVSDGKLEAQITKMENKDG